VWDVRTRKSRTLARGVSSATVRKVRFAPGKGNFRLLALYMDGAVSVWDAREGVLVGQLSGGGVRRTLDAEWAASDRVALAGQDGCIRVTGPDLGSASSGNFLLFYANYVIEKWRTIFK